jgi:hypothetical protein
MIEHQQKKKESTIFVLTEYLKKTVQDFLAMHRNI